MALQNIYEAPWSLKTNWSLEKLLIRDFRQGRCLLARLDHGADIIGQIILIWPEEKEIETGVFSVIGALSRAELGYYDQVSLKYGRIQIEEPVELVSCSGNISLQRRPAFCACSCRSVGPGREWSGEDISPGARSLPQSSIARSFWAGPWKEIHDSITGLNLWSEE